MFKNSSDALSYVNRVASHATKPRPSGRIDDIPPWAAEPEAYYNSVRDQYRSLAEQQHKIQDELTTINEKLKVRLPLKEYEHLRQHKERLAARFNLLKPQAAAFREMARAAGERAWATVFYLIARKLLPWEDFKVLLDETRQFLGRQETEVRKGESEWTEQHRDSRNEHEKRRQRRTRFRKRATGSVTVWRDNEPVKQQYADDMRRKD